MSEEHKKAGLETVDEHNARCRFARQERERFQSLTGVACPKCGKELKWLSVIGYSCSAATNNRIAECKSCGLTVLLER